MSAPVFDPTGLEPRSATDEQRASGPLARTPAGTWAAPGRAAADGQRAGGPLAGRPEGTWAVLGHAGAMEVAGGPDRYSSAVSRFLQVPTGLDGVGHTAIRAATDPFFGPEEMAAFEPVLRDV